MQLRNGHGKTTISVTGQEKMIPRRLEIYLEPKILIDPFTLGFLLELLTIWSRCILSINWLMIPRHPDAQLKIVRYKFGNQNNRKEINCPKWSRKRNNLNIKLFLVSVFHALTRCMALAFAPFSNTARMGLNGNFSTFIFPFLIRPKMCLTWRRVSGLIGFTLSCEWVNRPAYTNPVASQLITDACYRGRGKNGPTCLSSGRDCSPPILFASLVVRHFDTTMTTRPKLSFCSPILFCLMRAKIA